MIPIKYRGRSVNTNEWVYSETLSSGTIKRKRYNKYLEVDGKWRGVIPETIGIFLGHDNDGKEIYSNSELVCDENIRHRLVWDEAMQKKPEDYAFARIAIWENKADKSFNSRTGRVMVFEDWHETIDNEDQE